VVNGNAAPTEEEENNLKKKLSSQQKIQGSLNESSYF